MNSPGAKGAAYVERQVPREPNAKNPSVRFEEGGATAVIVLLRPLLY
jgi:hypothetical protein